MPQKKKTAQQEPAASDSELLDGMLDYLDNHIGALDMIHEALGDGRTQVSEDIPVAPVDALDSVIDNLTDETVQVRAKRALAGQAVPDEPPTIH